MKTKLKNQKGFTIIEVLIVLAIAGLILLIVFLAVPALQRNQRNTSRKNDIGRVGGAATEFLSNNNGTPPVSANNGTILTSAGTLSQYDATAPQAIVTKAQNALATSSTTVKQYRIVTGAACGATGATVDGPSTRAMAIQYVVEAGGGGYTAICQDI